MATIKDVAKRANVSTTTVSHVINKTRFVAEETRNAVWAAIKELHYSPSAVARSLKVNHTKSIGLLATSSEAAYFAEIIEAVEKNCFQKGYTLILGNAWNNLQKQRAYLSMMAQKRVDGLLVMCSEYPEPLLAMLEEYRHIPMVVMDWGEAKADFTDAVIDNAFEGGYMAGRYLIERGHREIGVIPGPLERNTGAGRLAGFMKAMEEAMKMIAIIVTDFEAGQVLEGKVVSIKEFGAFVEFAPGKEGMVHISKISKERIKNVEDVLTLGDKVKVVCLGKDKMGRMSFSIKDVAE